MSTPGTFAFYQNDGTIFYNGDHSTLREIMRQEAARVKTETGIRLTLPVQQIALRMRYYRQWPSSTADHLLLQLRLILWGDSGPFDPDSMEAAARQFAAQVWGRIVAEADSMKGTLDEPARIDG